MAKPVVEWRPDKKNGGSPLGPIYLDGGWNGYMGHGEALSYANHHGVRLKITGPLAAYAEGKDSPKKDDKMGKKKSSKKKAKKKARRRPIKTKQVKIKKRFTASGVACIMIWTTEEDGRRVPCLRLYEPRNPENGHALKKPDGSRPSFKDYKMRTMTDPNLKILDPEGSFEFVETEEGECYFDFTLEVLGKA